MRQIVQTVYYFPDGELKCVCIRALSGESIYDISAEFKDQILLKMTALLKPYGDVIQAVEGSLIIQIRFHSLTKLAHFWLIYLDGSLANQMLEVFMTEEISASHDPSSLHLDLEFDLNSYVEVAYQLSMHPSTPAITTTGEYHSTAM